MSLGASKGCEIPMKKGIRPRHDVRTGQGYARTNKTRSRETSAPDAIRFARSPSESLRKHEPTPTGQAGQRFAWNSWKSVVSLVSCHVAPSACDAPHEPKSRERRDSGCPSFSHGMKSKALGAPSPSSGSLVVTDGSGPEVDSVQKNKDGKAGWTILDHSAE